MGNRHVSIYCLWESKEQSFNWVSEWGNLNYEIMIDRSILYHCDYPLLLVFITAYHTFKMHLEYISSPLGKNYLGGAKEKCLQQGNTQCLAGSNMDIMNV